MMKYKELTKEFIYSVIASRNNGDTQAITTKKTGVTNAIYHRICRTPSYESIVKATQNSTENEDVHKLANDWILANYSKSDEVTTLTKIYNDYFNYVVVTKCICEQLSKKEFLETLIKLGFKKDKSVIIALYIQKVAKDVEDVYCLPCGRRAY